MGDGGGDGGMGGGMGGWGMGGWGDGGMGGWGDGGEANRRLNVGQVLAKCSFCSKKHTFFRNFTGVFSLKSGY